MKAFFHLLTNLSLRFRVVTLLLVAVVLILGGIATTQLNQELLPPIEFPQTIILAQASGMSSEQVLTVLTQRLETELDQVESIVNLESTTTGAFGSVIIARNNFGVNQERLLNDIQAAVDRVWLPLRRIQAGEGENPQDFAQRLLGEMTPDVLIFLAEREPNFLFQLSPEVWAALPVETVRQTLAYLSDQVAETGGSALQQLVDQEIVPQLDGLEVVANVQVAGGQALPGESTTTAVAEAQTESLLLQLSPEVWRIVAPQLSLEALDENAVSALQSVDYTVSEQAPALPPRWQMDRFTDASDLLEVPTLTSTLAGVFNNFITNGVIVGSLGQTNDLRVDDITQLLAVEPTLIDYLEAEQLVALSPEVFAVLPTDFIANLDGFTRDALSSASLAESITGETADRAPVNLPSAWRISPPQLITFSFADLPLATFSVSTVGEGSQVAVVPDETTETETAPAANSLAPILSVVGGLFGSLGSGGAPELPDAWRELAAQPQFADQPLQNAGDLLELGDGQASAVLNTINASIPEQFAGTEVRLFDSLTPEIIGYFVENEPDFYQNLNIEVLSKFSPETLQQLPADLLATLDPAVSTELTAIASGEQPSAFADLSALYVSNVAPADPDAPVLNADWQFIGDFLGVELDTADDFSRFYPDTTAFLNSFFDSAQGANFAPNLFGGLSLEALNYMVEKEPVLLNGLRVEALQLLEPSVLAALPQEVQDRAAAGGEPFVPTNTVTRSNDNSSLLLTVYKTRDANTVEAFHAVESVIEEAQARDPNLRVSVAFEQASFIEESISGVAREGTLGALFAMVVILVFLSAGHWASSPRRVTGIVMIVLFGVLLALILATAAGSAGGNLNAALSDLPENSVIAVFLLGLGIAIGLLIALSPVNLPYPAWRATLVIGVSIPLSVMATMALMRWFSPAMHNLLAPAAENSALFGFVIRLFPANLTLNIMTLSGLTVAIGRVVDDSIVVLENIIRQMQTGMDKREAILTGTRDVSQAIFVATLVTVVVFLPLGLTGGIIGEFFLPFGLAVTYSLLASFVVAITVVPVLVFLFIPTEQASEEESQSFLERAYLPVLRWSISSNRNRLIVLAVSFATMIFGFALFGGRPAAFLPSFGEPQIGVAVNLPVGTKITDTNALAVQMEDAVRQIVPEDERGSVLTIVGGGGMSLQSFFTGSSVTENAASITVGLSNQDNLDAYTEQIRTEAARVFGAENVSVSAASLSEQGFGGFAVVLSGPQADLQAVNAQVIETIDNVDGIANATSNLAPAAAMGEGDNTPPTLIRIDGETAVRYTGELETQNTIGVTQEAIAAVSAMPNLPTSIKISQGFETETQVQGFQSLFVAMGIAIAIMIVILVFTFGSPVYWVAIILSIMVAPVGAAVALTLTNRVLGISALIGLLMLIGIVVTNAVVLIDRAHTNDVKKKMPVNDALAEAGDRRLRPIIMTALATIMALMPLAIGLSRGAIIASELGTVVIGGLFSSTLLTLIVVPVAYKMLHPLHNAVVGLFRRSGEKPAASPSGAD